LANRKTFAKSAWTRPFAQVSLTPEAFRLAANLPASSDKEVVPVRAIVIVLIGLVVVLAVLTELCLLQAAAMRRKVRAVLPPDEEEDR
jgi:hypothetical protein